jgi:hypothetical protein
MALAMNRYSWQTILLEIGAAGLLAVLGYNVSIAIWVGRAGCATWPTCTRRSSTARSSASVPR